MPSSHYFQLNEIVDLIVMTNPGKLLDIGVGFGKYGFLAREYLELWSEGADYHKWTRQIDGIEAFGNYIHPAHNFIYNKVYVGNAAEVVPSLNDKYDLILMIDVFEHFTFRDGWKLLAECRKKSRNIIISVPLLMLEQDDVFENPFEEHKYGWKKKDFKSIPDKFFLKNRKSLICFIGEESERIRSEKRRMVAREKTIKLLELLKIKKLVKSMIGR